MKLCRETFFKLGNMAVASVKSVIMAQSTYIKSIADTTMLSVEEYSRYYNAIRYVSNYLR